MIAKCKFSFKICKTILSTQPFYIFLLNLTINSHYFHARHSEIVLYNGECEV